MKKQNLLTNLFSVIFILGLLGYCGKKEEKKSEIKNPFDDPQQVAEVICNKMFDCVIEQAMVNMPNVDMQMKTLKENCKTTIIKYQEKEIKKEAKGTSTDSPTQEEISACFNAIKDATCEQIKNNQVPACTALNKYTTQ